MVAEAWECAEGKTTTADGISRPPLCDADQAPTTKQTLVVPLPPMLRVAMRLAPSTW